MKHLNIFLTLLLTMFLAGCNTATRNMTFENTECVTAFPEKVSIGNGEVVDLGIIGIRDMFIHDSLMFISAENRDGLISVFTLPDHKRAGSYFHKGNGPGELITCPFFSSYSISRGKRNTDVLFPDGRGHFYKWNISSLSEDSKPELTLVRDSMPTRSFYTIYVNDSTFLHRDIKPDVSGQERYLTINGRKHITPSMEKLNSAYVDTGNDSFLVNLMSSLVCYNSEYNMVVEVSVSLNTINMYTLDGSFEKTICIGKKPDDIEQAAHKGVQGMKDTFTDVQMFDLTFAVMMYSEEVDKMSPSASHKATIYLFDWEGNPVLEAELKEPASRFAVCNYFENNTSLYTIDDATETVRRYDFNY